MKGLVYKSQDHLPTSAPRVDPYLVAISLTIDLIPSLRSVITVVFIHENRVSHTTLGVLVIVDYVGRVCPTLKVLTECTCYALVFIV